jgi:hypothetical protein
MAPGAGSDRSRGGPSPSSARNLVSAVRFSTVGRPRLLTDAQVAIVLAEHARFVAWRALRKCVKSQRQLAREFGVSQSTISLVVRMGGRYKQKSS